MNEGHQVEQRNGAPGDTSGGQVIRRQAPFDLSFIEPEYCGYAHLLAGAIAQIRELPDFSEDSKIAFFSDFGGEHKAASFNTYSFLIMAYNKVGPFEDAVKALRERHGISSPFSEFKFKDLSFGPRLRALPEFLEIVDTLVHGAIVTVAIEKRIETVFGPTKKQAHTTITKLLSELDMGTWDGRSGERALRICHAMAIFAGLTTTANQRVLWYCDNDAINADGRHRSFQDIRRIFMNALGMYCKHGFEVLGFGKSFEEKSHLDDLLSISDFAAGIVQDLLQANKTGHDEIPGAEGKMELIKWIARDSKYLSKITIQIAQLDDGSIGQGLVEFQPLAT